MGWWLRLRFFAAALLMWLALHYLVGPLLPSGHERPLVLSSSALGIVAMPLAVLILWVGVAIAARWLTPGDARHPLMAMGLALAIWAAEGGRTGGVLDHWLLAANTTQGTPRGAPYAWLLWEYAWLIPAVLGAWVITTWDSTPSSQTWPTRIRATLLPQGAANTVQRGWLVLLITAAAGALAMHLLCGPAGAWTLRGQVYFAVGVGLFTGVFVARQCYAVHDPRWFIGAPLLLGILGLLVAALRPALNLPPELAHLDTIPAWALARPLPLEMVGVGLVGVLCSLTPPEGNATTTK